MQVCILQLLAIWFRCQLGRLWRWVGAQRLSPLLQSLLAQHSNTPSELIMMRYTRLHSCDWRRSCPVNTVVSVHNTRFLQGQCSALRDGVLGFCRSWPTLAPLPCVIFVHLFPALSPIFLTCNFRLLLQLPLLLLPPRQQMHCVR